jgi:hypothetical protein
MPTESFWKWQKISHLCTECREEPKDCMRCEIVWDAALESMESAPFASSNNERQCTTSISLCEQRDSCHGYIDDTTCVSSYNCSWRRETAAVS